MVAFEAVIVPMLIIVGVGGFDLVLLVHFNLKVVEHCYYYCYYYCWLVGVVATILLLTLKGYY